MRRNPQGGDDVYRGTGSLGGDWSQTPAAKATREFAGMIQSEYTQGVRLGAFAAGSGAEAALASGELSPRWYPRLQDHTTVQQPNLGPGAGGGAIGDFAVPIRPRQKKPQAGSSFSSPRFGLLDELLGAGAKDVASLFVEDVVEFAYEFAPHKELGDAMLAGDGLDSLHVCLDLRLQSGRWSGSEWQLGGSVVVVTWSGPSSTTSSTSSTSREFMRETAHGAPPRTPRAPQNSTNPPRTWFSASEVREAD